MKIRDYFDYIPTGSDISIRDLEQRRIELQIACLLMPAFFAVMLFLQSQGIFVDNSLYSFSYFGYILFSSSFYSVIAFITYLLLEHTEYKINKLKKEIHNVDNNKQ